MSTILVEIRQEPNPTFVVRQRLSAQTRLKGFFFCVGKGPLCE